MKYLTLFIHQSLYLGERSFQTKVPCPTHNEEQTAARQWSCLLYIKSVPLHILLNQTASGLKMKLISYQNLLGQSVMSFSALLFWIFLYACLPISFFKLFGSLFFLYSFVNQSYYIIKKVFLLAKPFFSIFTLFLRLQNTHQH